tara:strand:- start:3153 stop:3407 length:255 start_codon:yes stop_codon:yes gene_type:complete
MTDKLIYQVDQLEEKLKKLHTEFDDLNAQVIEVEKNLLLLKSEAASVEQSVKTMKDKSGWLYKIITAGFVSAIIGWIVAGGLGK